MRRGRGFRYNYWSMKRKGGGREDGSNREDPKYVKMRREENGPKRVEERKIQEICNKSRAKEEILIEERKEERKGGKMRAQT
jgi:hypothetical protein